VQPEVRSSISTYGGTFDHPNWFDRSPEMTRHIFLDSAQNGKIMPGDVSTFRKRTMLNDGTPVAPTVFEGTMRFEKSGY
jgi:hypothetical protein